MPSLSVLTLHHTPNPRPTSPLGHGAYGVVVSALDRQTGARVAIKKCPNVFEDPLDAKRIAREIRLLRHFHHPNIIKVRARVRGSVGGWVGRWVCGAIDGLNTKTESCRSPT